MRCRCKLTIARRRVFDEILREMWRQDDGVRLCRFEIVGFGRLESPLPIHTRGAQEGDLGVAILLDLSIASSMQTRRKESVDKSSL